MRLGLSRAALQDVIAVVLRPPSPSLRAQMELATGTSCAGSLYIFYACPALDATVPNLPWWCPQWPKSETKVVWIALGVLHVQGMFRQPRWNPLRVENSRVDCGVSLFSRR